MWAMERGKLILPLKGRCVRVTMGLGITRCQSGNKMLKMIDRRKPNDSGVNLSRNGIFL